MFNLGNKVTWLSYPGGNEKRNTGVIVDVLDAGERPPKSKYPSIWKKGEPGQGRNHESYIVQADNGQHYWPVVSRLEIVSQGKPSKTKTQPKPGRVINYVGFSLDHSGSMGGKTNAAMRDFNENLNAVLNSSAQYAQTSYITVSECGVYLGGRVTYGNRITYHNAHMNEVDPLRSYSAQGNTPLYDSIVQLVDHMQSIPKHNATDDISYLVYIITDGEENASNTTKYELRKRIQELQATGRWTFTFRVPYGSEHTVMDLGVPRENILTWDGKTEESYTKSSALNLQATTAYYSARASGQTQTASFYANLQADDQTVKSVLADLTPSVWLWPVTEDIDIRSFVLQHINNFTIGKGFYQLTKSEEVQPYKKLIVQDKRDGKIYGGDQARSLLGIPVNQVGNIKLRPGATGNYDVFVESTSVNRKLIKDTRLLYLK